MLSKTCNSKSEARLHLWMPLVPEPIFNLQEEDRGKGQKAKRFYKFSHILEIGVIRPRE